MIETFKIGNICRTHGIKGMLCMNFTDDVWDRADSDYLFLEIDGLPVPFFLEEWRFLSDRQALLKFEDIDDEKQAQPYVGCDVLFPTELVPEGDGEAEITSWRHFIGWTVIDEHAGEIGTIDSVDDTTANTLFYIGDRIIPANENFITSVDSKARTIHTDLPKGLLDI